MIRGIHHLGLTVRDVDASAAWYEEVLGFRRVGEFQAPGGARRKVFLRHDGLQARLGLTQHRHADLVDTLYRGLADNSAGKVIDTLLRNDLLLVDEVGFAPLDDTAAQLLFRLVSAAYERRALGVASHWPFDQWGRFLPEHTTAVSLLDRLLHHANVVVTDGDSYRMRQARARGGTTLNKN